MLLGEHPALGGPAQARQGERRLDPPRHERRQVDLPGGHQTPAGQQVVERGVQPSGRQPLLATRVEVLQAETGLEHRVRDRRGDLVGGVVAGLIMGVIAGLVASLVGEVAAGDRQGHDQRRQRPADADPPRPRGDERQRLPGVTLRRRRVALVHRDLRADAREHRLPRRRPPQRGIAQELVTPGRGDVGAFGVDQHEQRPLQRAQGHVVERGGLQHPLGGTDRVLVGAGAQDVGQRRHGRQLGAVGDGCGHARLGRLRAPAVRAVERSDPGGQRWMVRLQVLADEVEAGQ